MSQEHVQEEVNLDEILNQDLHGESVEDDFYSGDYNEGFDLGLTPEEQKTYEMLQQKIMSQDPIMEFYKQLETKPSDEQIEMWKEQVGDVYFAQISEQEYFVFRAIKRKEWRDLLKRLEQVKDPLKQDEAIVMKGVLYPQLDNLKVNLLSAGSVNTMKDLIMQASNFLSAEYALQLVRKL